MQFGGNSIFTFAERVQISAPFANPFGVVMSFRPVISWCMTEFPESVTVSKTWFSSVARALQMKLADQATVVTGVGNQFRNQRRVIGPVTISIAAIGHAGGIHTRHKARSAGRANGALAIGVSKRDTVFHQPVKSRSVNVWVAESPDRVKTLLVGAIPQNV